MRRRRGFAPSAGTGRGARDAVGRLVQVASGHALAEWLPWSAVLDGLVTAANGDLDEGIVRVQDGLNGLRNVGAGAGRIYALLTLGRLCLAGAQVQRGLEAVDEALTLCNERGHAQEHLSELFRIRAALLLAQSTDLEPEAEDLLMRAHDVACNQTARMHEIRVMLDLAPLWAPRREERRGPRRHRCVAPVVRGGGHRPGARARTGAAGSDR